MLHPILGQVLGDREGFVSRYTSLFKEYLAGKKKSYSKSFSETVRRDRQSSVASDSTGSETASVSGSSVRAAGEMHAVAGPVIRRLTAVWLVCLVKKTARAASKSSTESRRGVAKKDVKDGEQSDTVSKRKPAKAAVKKTDAKSKGK